MTRLLLHFLPRRHAAYPRRVGTVRILVAFVSVVSMMAIARLTAQRGAAPSPIAGGRYEASGVVSVPGSADALLFVDDNHPKHIFVMRVSADGRQIGSATAVAIGADVPDMEDIASDGTFIYVIGSQSHGQKRADGLVRFRVDARTSQVSQVERVAGLRQWLAAAVPELQADRRRATNDLNIEGLVWDAARGRLLLGLRSPMAGSQALLVPLRLRDASAPLSAGNLQADTAMRLDLGGLAVRGLGRDPSTGALLVIGGASTTEKATTFRVFEWDGTPDALPRQIETFPAHDKPEGITRTILGGRLRTVIVFDSGGYLVE